ncbi:MAG: putative short-chain type dehydrogenase/reductase [Acidimicrobiales bacterium]|nr:putative short-chain type dehydrogenase/reductase [Acidimicrobiales bacterium]
MLLEGKTAIVTGAGRGLGRAHALALAAHGARVVVNDLGTDVEGNGTGQVAEEVVETITSAGGEAVANLGSCADFDAAGDLIAQAVDTFGSLDILVNNAGNVRDRTIFNMTEEEWDSVINVHLKGHFAPTHHACAYWRQEAKAGRARAGRIVCTTSQSGLFGNPGQANYAAAKAGIAAFTQVVAMEMARYGVTANAVAPAARTRMSEDLIGPAPEGFDPMAPENVSPLVVWLASDDAHWVTGQVFHMMGGQCDRLEGWHIVATRTRSGRLWEAEELADTVRALYGTFPGGIAGALGAEEAVAATGIGQARLQRTAST